MLNSTQVAGAGTWEAVAMVDEALMLVRMRQVAEPCTRTAHHAERPSREKASTRRELLKNSGSGCEAGKWEGKERVRSSVSQ